MKTKEGQRKYYKEYRDNIDFQDITIYSNKIKNIFLNLKEVQTADKFMLYYSIKSEVKTHSLIKQLLEQNKKVFLPYTIIETREMRFSMINNLQEDVVTGNYGIKEPADKTIYPIDKLEVVVVPGVVFAKDGYRLGYGGGYYDRFLSRINKSSTVIIGFTFNSLLVDSIPHDKYDQKVDIIITENGITRVGGGNN